MRRSWPNAHSYTGSSPEFQLRLTLTLLSAVQASIKAGQTAADAAATLKLPDRYRNYDMRQAKANVEAIYKELAGR